MAKTTGIYAGAYQLDVPFSGRVVAVYLLLGDAPSWIDGGVASSPKTSIHPSLTQLGLRTSQLCTVVNTDARADDCGGHNHLRQHNRQVRSVMHSLERGDIQTPMNAVWALCEPYRGVIGSAKTDAVIAWNAEDLGQAVRIDHTVERRDRLALGSERSIVTYLTPGHTQGHPTVYDPEHQAAFIGDVVCWRGDHRQGLTEAIYPIPEYG